MSIEFFLNSYFSLITDEGIDDFCAIFVVMIGGGVIVKDINGGIVFVINFGCICVRSLVSSISNSVGRPY
jgi:hypothetical protein